LITNNLKYFIDSSNLESKYTRNKLRNNIIPKFEEINSNYRKNINNLTSYLKELKNHIDTELKDFLEEQ
jgi:tRNA(Ile)-lysidine synthase